MSRAAQAGASLLGATTLSTRPPKKPTPTPPSTTAATQWPLYSAYPPGTDWTFSQAVPASQNPSQGYDVNVSRLNSARRTALYNQANGQLLDGPGGYSFLMFIQNFNLDLTLAGSYGQSQYTRDFYARNFVQPQVTVTGQSPSQEDYGLLCEFVHSCQHKAVANGYQNLTQLFIAGRNKADGFDGRGIDGARSSGTRVIISEPGNLMSGRTSDPSTASDGTYYSQLIHGAHQPFLAKGYISSMPRIHQQFQYAVQWTMVFMIAAILDGPFNDLGQAQSLPNQAPVTWINMLQDIQKTGVISSNTPGLAKQNQAIVRAASTVSINPLTPNFNPAPSSGSSGGGLGSSTGNITDVGSVVKGLIQAANGHGIPSLFVVTVWLSEGEVTDNSPNSDGARGYFQFTSGTPYGFYPGGGQPINFPNDASDLGIAANLFCGAASYAAQQGLSDSSGTVPAGFNMNNQSDWETWAEAVQQPGAGAYSSYWSAKLGQAQQLISQYGG